VLADQGCPRLHDIVEGLANVDSILASRQEKPSPQRYERFARLLIDFIVGGLAAAQS
jgi:hypothetical protein